MYKGKKIFLTLVFIIVPVAVIFSLYYFFYASSGDRWSVQCSFYQTTGYLCPGCGGQRAFHALIHGQWQQVLRYNALTVFIIPFLGYCYFIIIQQFVFKNKGLADKYPLTPGMAYAFLILLFVFFVIRNIPYFPFNYLRP